MKIPYVNILIVLSVVFVVLAAGCTSTPSTGTTGSAGSTTASPAQTAAASATTAAAGSASQTSAASAGSVVSGSDIFGSSPSYSWLEYKTVTTSEGKTMTMYLKYSKSGTCSMRIEGEGMPSGGMTMDCSSSGSQEQQSNPSDVKSDVKFTVVSVEPVTVPAGTYAAATKYAVTSNGQTVYYWTASGVPGFVKMEYSSSDGDMVTELNGWG